MGIRRAEGACALGLLLTALGVAPASRCRAEEPRPLQQPYGAYASSERMVELTGSEDNVVRMGPGADYAIVGVFDKGETFLVIAKSAEWYNVRLSETETGWIHSSLCREFADLSHLEFRPNPRLYSRVGSFYLTGYGGGYSFDRKSNSLVLGGRFGYQMFEYVDFEGALSWSHIVRPAEIVENLFQLQLAEEDFHMLSYSMNVNLRVLPGRQMVPFACAGFGSSIMQGETEPAFNYGAGTFLFVSKTVAMRWEFRAYQFESGFGGARRYNHNFEFTMGTSLLF